jgi:hypothetical protein
MHYTSVFGLSTGSGHHRDYGCAKTLNLVGDHFFEILEDEEGNEIGYKKIHLEKNGHFSEKTHEREVSI